MSPKTIIKYNLNVVAEARRAVHWLKYVLIHVLFAKSPVDPVCFTIFLTIIFYVLALAALEHFRGKIAHKRAMKSV